MKPTQYDARSILTGGLVASAATLLLSLYPAAPAPEGSGLTAEQEAILGHMSLVFLPDGQGGQTRTIRITGVNVQLVNGSGMTASATGLGNLIVGYNELGGGDIRTGSHNIVCGSENSYASYGGAVFAFQNKALAPYSTVTGGRRNTARGDFASISGGFVNKAGGNSSSITGGNGNSTTGVFSTVSGGIQNRAIQTFSSVSGGDGNVASGLSSSVSGGQSNIASGPRASVSGGRFNEASDFESSVAGGESNVASGKWSAASGGQFNLASHTHSTASGGCGGSSAGDCDHTP